MITEIAAAEAPTIIGTPFAGGFYMGRYFANGEERALIDSGRAGDLYGAWGEYSKDIPGAKSYFDGRANTIAMAEAGSELAQKVLLLEIGGCNDWYLPARDQLELQYRFGKPTTQENYCSFRDGENPSVVPATYPYTKENPIQTVADNYRAGGAEAFRPEWHWTSTQFSPTTAWVQTFGHGHQRGTGKGNEFAARAVRSLKIINSSI